MIMKQKIFVLKLLLLTLLITISLCSVSPALDLDYYLAGSLGCNAEEYSGRDNAYGFNLTSGTLINDKFACELQYEKILDFDTKNNVSQTDVDIKSCLFNVIYHPVQEKSNIQGYIKAGMGWMKTEVAKNGIPKTQKKDEEGLCLKLGVGSDFKVSEIITFFLEAAYTEGCNDINPIDYFSGVIGIKLFLFPKEEHK